MKLFQDLASFLDKNRQIGILLLRIFVGFRILYGVIDNIFSWKKMIEFSQSHEAYKSEPELCRASPL
ncbi:MAG: hypothetical protein KJP00_11475, partial [Bacteroidia bacterium]|nr:hypothetical protein [Bacteroidia bacterium]